MFLHKFKQIVIPKRVYKNLKFQYQLTLIEQLFFSKSFVFFYFFDFASSIEIRKLDKFLKAENFKKLILKKKTLNFIFKSVQFNFLKNLNLNNIILIYPTMNNMISPQNFTILNQFKNYTLIAMLYNFKILRASEIEKLFSISILKVIVQTIFIKKFYINILKKKILFAFFK